MPRPEAVSGPSDTGLTSMSVCSSQRVRMGTRALFILGSPRPAQQPPVVCKCSVNAQSED